MKPNRLLKLFVTLGFLGVAFGAAAQQPPSVTVRGVIAGFDGKVLSVKSREGKEVTIDLPETVNVSVAKPFTVAEIRPGMMLAVTTLARPDGSVVALDVRPLPPTVQITQSSSNLQEGAAMNNSALEGIAAGANGQELTLNTKTGPLKALIVPQTTLSQSGPGSRDDLKPGETVFVSARQEGDRLAAVRVQVSKDGVKPGM